MKRVRLPDQWCVRHVCVLRGFGHTYSRSKELERTLRAWKKSQHACISGCRVVQVERWAIVPTERKKHGKRRHGARVENGNEDFSAG